MENDLPHNMTVEEVVMAGILVSLDEGKRTAEEIRVHVIALLEQYGHDLTRGLTILDQVLSERHPDAEYVIALGGDLVMSARGREVVDMAKRKLSVNELIGEDKIELDKDDVERIQGASENVPG